MSETIGPQVVETAYVNIAGYHWVGADVDAYGNVYWDVEYTEELYDTSRYLAEAGLNAEHHRLITWVEFYRQACIYVRHTENYVPEKIEQIRGIRMPIGEVLYAVGAEDDGTVVFEPCSSILMQGALTPYMTRWLELHALSDHKATPEIERLLPLLPGSPASHYELRAQVRKKAVMAAGLVPSGTRTRILPQQRRGDITSP